MCVGENGPVPAFSGRADLCGGVIMLEVSFDIMQSCAIAAAVVLIGRAIVKRVRFFSDLLHSWSNRLRIADQSDSWFAAQQ